MFVAKMKENGEIDKESIQELNCKEIEFLKLCEEAEGKKRMTAAKSKITFLLDGCDISFVASAPEDITLKQLLAQCDKIKPNWCACGICSTDDENIEIEIDYDSIKKVAHCECTIKGVDD